MTRDVQLPEPAADLLETCGEVTAAWLTRSMAAAAARTGSPVDDRSRSEIDRVAAAEARRLLDELSVLLATDVDEQRTNPLSLFRRAVTRGPTGLLRSLGVPPPAPDDFAATAFPDDVYRLGPANWSDVDPALHEPGITWGAWKAMTVLRRRRDEGRR